MNRRSALFLLLALGLFASQHLPANWSLPFLKPDLSGAWVLLIEESAETTPAAAAFRQNVDLKASWEARGLKWREYDVDDPAAIKFVSPAREVGLPAVVIIDRAGKVVGKTKLTETTNVDDYVKGVTGR